MSAKKFSLLGVTIVLLAMSLVGGGCATTSSQNASYKPHKPQMITANGPVEVGENEFAHTLNHGFKLSDETASALTGLGRLLGLPGTSQGYSWKP
jgi:hypothetical protein